MKTREALVLEEIARSKEVAGQGSRNDTSAKSCRGFVWREDVAEEMDGVSHESVRKGTEVYKTANPSLAHSEEDTSKYDVPDIVRNVAQVQVERMDEGKQSFTPL